jgi:transcriptional regulator with XRE-family HTH domain
MAKRKLGAHSLIFDDDEVIQLLSAAVQREGTQDAFARRHGINRTHLNQILNGKKSVNATVMKALRLRASIASV